MILPATRTNELIEEINKFLDTARTYMPKEDFQFKRIVNEGSRLVTINAIEGNSVLANVYAAAGDVDAAREHLDKILRLTDEGVYWCNRAAILSNLGYFSEAQQAFQRGANPIKGWFGNKEDLAICVGAFRTYLEFVQTARKMNLTIDEGKLDLIRRATFLLDEFSVSDHGVASIFDVAGTVLREERLFFSGLGPDTLAWDRDPLEKYLAFSFRLPVSAQRAAALDRKLGHRLFEVDDLPFQVMLHFESGLSLNERFPERPAIAS